jgi:multicomponent Na+:H+ antiporter subunit B
MRSPILPVAAKFLLPLILLFSIFLLLRGHDEPGGAFVGGLVGAAAFALHLMAHGASRTRRAFPVQPRSLIVAGLLLASLTAAAPLLAGWPLLATGWREVAVPGGQTVHVGTPLLFEIGVYLVVLGATLTIFVLLAED